MKLRIEVDLDALCLPTRKELRQIETTLLEYLEDMVFTDPNEVFLPSFTTWKIIREPRKKSES